MILDLYQSDQSVEQLAEEYAIAPQTIYCWKKLYTKNENANMTEIEILTMKKEMNRMKQQNSLSQTVKMFQRLTDTPPMILD